MKEGKKTGQTEEEMGRQHQGMDRPGVRQVPEGSGEQRKIEETGCEVICGAPATLAVKRQVKVNMKVKESLFPKTSRGLQASGEHSPETFHDVLMAGHGSTVTSDGQTLLQ